MNDERVAAATTIVNANVFDGTRLQPWTSIRFADGVITVCSVDAAARVGDDVIDARGGTVFPGLIDTHVHLVPGALAQSLNFGVTTVLDMFSTPDVVAVAREQAASRTDVADIRSSVVGATAPGGHPSVMYPPFPTLTSAAEAERFVSERIAEGADYLKIFSGPGGLWPWLDDETTTALVIAAHARGLIVVAHVSSVAGVEQVVVAGVDVIAHVPARSVIDGTLISRIAAAGIAVGPTLATSEKTFGRSGNAAVPADTVRRLAKAGVALLAGTDAPNPGVAFGTSLHRELELLVESGLSPAQALAAGTSEPARVFGLGDRGRIAVGMRADLVLVSGDPLADITRSRTIEGIWRAGVPCDRGEFVPTAAEAKQLAAFDERVAKAVSAVRERRNGFRPRTFP